LSWLPRKQWVAPALVWLIANRGRPKRVLEFLKALDRYAYGLLILGEAACKTEEDATTRSLRSLGRQDVDLANVFAFTAADTRSILNRAKFIIGNNNNLKVAKLILLRIHVRDERKTGDIRVYWTWRRHTRDANNIEHVLPDSPAPAAIWPSLFGARCRRVHKMIGNLFIVPERSQQTSSRTSRGRRREAVREPTYGRTAC
jgi:hypothetical protein